MFIEEHKCKDLRELRGRILFRENYDYKKLRRVGGCYEGYCRI